MKKMGPYRDEKTANLVAQAFIHLGETVRVEEVFEPYGTEYQAFVIRGES
jgi:hypothetical protein